MKIKEITQSDLMKAQELYCNSFQREPQEITLSPLGKIIGIFLEDELIGITQIDFINHVFENKRIAYLNSICIKECYRNQGYGQELLQECIKIARQNKANMINMTSNKNRIYAHKLYEKNNFYPVDTIFLKKDL